MVTIQKSSPSSTRPVLLICMLAILLVVVLNGKERKFLRSLSKEPACAPHISSLIQSSAPRTSCVVDWSIPADIINIRSNECGNGSQTTSSGAFCIGNSGVNYMGVDVSLAEGLLTFFDGASVVDLGAGLGGYGKFFLTGTLRHRPVSSYRGFDGAVNVAEKTGGFVQHMDLTQPSAIDRRQCGDVADWVMSLEVAEHIPVQFTDAFLRNIRCRARKGAVISWGQPGQGGLGHVNNRAKEDAIALVERWGFKADMEASDRLQKMASFEHFKAGTLTVYHVVE